MKESDKKTLLAFDNFSWVKPEYKKSIGIETLVKWGNQELLTSNIEKAGYKDPSMVKVINDNGSFTNMWTYPFNQITQLTFLKMVSLSKNEYRDLRVIEFGCSSGRMTWKLLLTGAEVYANDLYSNQLDLAEQNILKKIPALAAKFHRLDGDALTTLANNPQLKTSFDFVLAENVIHFFNPEQNIIFANIIYNFLVPKGIAVISANHVNAKKIDKLLTSPSLQSYLNHIDYATKKFNENDPNFDFPYFLNFDSNSLTYTQAKPNAIVDNLRITHSFDGREISKAYQTIGFKDIISVCYSAAIGRFAKFDCPDYSKGFINSEDSKANFISLIFQKVQTIGHYEEIPPAPEL